jgi:hypothetical protein
MIRRFILGVAVGLLAAFIATPAEAAEWCLHDPALVFSAPHSKHKITIYATEGVAGAAHENALAKSHLDFKAKPGKGHGTMQLDVHAKIPGKDHDSFATVLVVSSAPFGAGTIYGVVFGRSDHDMHVSFQFVYQDGG